MKLQSLSLLLMLLILIGCQASGGGGGDVVSGHVPQVPKFTLSTTLNRTYTLSQDIDFVLTFPATVTVTGTPELDLTVGATSRVATYVSGDGTSTLLFRYTIAGGDDDLNGISVGANINLNGGTLTYTKADATVDNCRLDMTIPALTTVKVDTVVPSLVSVTAPMAGTYYIAQNLIFTANFSEPVLISGTPRIAFDIGGVTRYATYLSGTNSSSIQFRYSVTASDVDNDGVVVSSPLELNGGAINDGALQTPGLTFTVPNTSTVLVAGANPIVTAVTPPTNGTYTANQILDFTLTFNKVVNIGGLPRLALTIGSTTKYANYLSGSGSTAIKFRYTVVGGDVDNDGISLTNTINMNGGSIQDSSLNNAVPLFITPNLSAVRILTSAPTISSITIPSSPPVTGYDVGQNIDFVVNFSEVMNETGNNSRLRLDVGGATRYAVYQSGSGTSSFIYRYTVPANDEDLNGLALVSPLQLNGSTILNTGSVALVLTYTAPVTTSLKVDAKAPTIISNTKPSNGSYLAGQNLDFDVTFSEPVVVSGSPRIILDIGGVTKYANYISGSATSVLRFRYAVTAPDADADGITVTATIDLNSGSIADPNFHGSALALPTTTTTGVLVDTIVPTITSVTPPANGNYSASQNLNFTVNWSENVSVTGTPRLALVIGSTTRYATYISGSGSSALLFRYTTVSGDNDADGITLNSPAELNGGTIRDAATNNGTLTFTSPNTSGVIVASSAPTISSITLPSNGTYTTGQNVDFTVVFSEAVLVTPPPRIALTLGSGTVYANYVSGGGSTSLLYRYTVAANDYDVDGLTMVSPVQLNGGAIQNLSMSQNAVLTFTLPNTSGILIDGVDATIASVTPPANKTYIVGENLDFIVNYSSNVTVTGTPSLSVTIGSSTVAANYLSGTGTSALTFRYTVVAGDLDADGISTTSPLALNAGTIQDVSNGNASLTFTSPNTSGVLVDAVAPVISSVAGPTPGSYYLNNDMDFDVTVSKTVIVTGTPRIALTVGSTTKYATYLSGSGSSLIKFRYTVSSGDLDSDGIAVISPLELNSGTIKDSVGNDLSPLTFTAPNTALVNVDGTTTSIISVTAPANATYKTAQNMNFSVLFTQPVNVTGTPRLAITIGGATAFANYLSGSGTTTLNFRYTVVSDDSDADGIQLTSPIGLNGGSIKDASTLNATLTFTAPNTSAILVDGIDLVISSVTPPANKTYLLGENMDYVVNFNGAAVVTGTPRIIITVGSTTRYATYLSGSGTNAHTYRYTVAASDVDTDGVTNTSNLDLNSGTVKDVFGDNADHSFLGVNYPNVKVDGVVPTIASVTGPSPATYLEGQNLDFTVNFSEAVTVTASPRIQLTIGSTTQYALYLSGSGTTSAIFRYVVQAGDIDLNGIASVSPIQLNSGELKDAGGNDVSPLTFTAPNTSGVNVDANAALITSVTPPSNSTYKTGNNLDFVVNYSKNVDVTGSPRIALTVGAATVYATYLSGSGSSALTFRYTVSASEVDADGIVVNSPIALNSGTIKDAGLVNAQLIFTPPTTTGVLVDGIDIVISSITYPADTTYKLAQDMDFTVNFNHPATVTATPRIQLTVGASTLYANYTSGSGTSTHIYRYTVGAADLDTDGITVISNIGLNGGTIKDAFGDNANLTFTGTTYANKRVDGIRPTISSAGSVTAKTYISTENIDFTLNYSEAVTITGSPRIVLTVGATTRYATYSSGSGTTAIVFRYTVPNGDLDTNGIAVANSNLIDLNSGTIADAAGNAQTNLLFTPPALTTVLVDGVAPAITGITSPTTYHGLASAINFTVTYSEAVTVTGTPTLSLNVGGGSRTASYISGSGSTSLVFRYTTVLNDSDTDGVATVSPLSLASGTMKDASGNNADLTFTGSTISGVQVDAVPPLVTSVTPPANATYKPSANLDFTVVMNESVNVTGTPSIALTIGSTTRQANYVSGSGSTSLLFRYTIVSGDNDYNGLTNNSTLQLNGGTIRDARLNNADTSSLGSISLSNVFTVPTLLSYWYDLSDTTTVGSSATTLLQFKSKIGTFDGTITGTPAYGINSFNSQSGGVTLSSTNYITMGTIQAKYIVVVFKTPSATGQRVLFDTAGGSTASRAMIQLNTSGTSGLNLGSNCGSSCKRYNGTAWSTANISGVLSYTWTTNQHRIMVIDYNGASNLSFQIGQNNYDGQIAEYFVFTGTTAVANSVIDEIASYLQTKHGASY